jgi:hypothetical protein
MGIRGTSVVAIVLLGFGGLSATQITAQTPAAQGGRYTGPRTADGKPDLNGIWQVFNAAHWNLEPHSAEEGVPAGQGVVEGGTIPYKPEALAKKKQNYDSRATADPFAKCYLPGVPRITYVPLPFEISQSSKYVIFAYEFAHARRIVYTDGSPHVEALEFWMGDSRGRWEGDTLVIDTNDFNDNTWLDKAGNYHSNALHVIERYTPTDSSHINYEVTIEDAKVFTRPWKMSMVMYRRVDPGLQLLEYDCVSFFWKKTIAAGRRANGSVALENPFDTGKEGVTCRAQSGDS